MRSNFDELNPKRQKAVEDITVNNSEYVSDTPPFADSLEEDENCLELLSAYIDGEVDASERRQVQEWLDNDPRIHKLYIKMLRVHQAMDQIPVPPSNSTSSTELSELVFQRIDQQRKGKFISFSSALVGAILLGMVTGLVVKGNSIPKLAQEALILANQKEEGLMIALNYPVIDIPASLASQEISKAKK